MKSDTLQSLLTLLRWSQVILEKQLIKCKFILARDWLIIAGLQSNYTVKSRLLLAGKYCDIHMTFHFPDCLQKSFVETESLNEHRLWFISNDSFTFISQCRPNFMPFPFCCVSGHMSEQSFGLPKTSVNRLCVVCACLRSQWRLEDSKEKWNAWRDTAGLSQISSVFFFYWCVVAVAS